MEREIKFRGLRSDGKGWVTGSVVYPNRLVKGVFILEDCSFADFYPDAVEGEPLDEQDHHGIMLGRFIEVIPETIGQFTGLTDKNGKEIYEGDNVMSFKKNYEDNPSINTVEFLLGCFKLVCTGKSDITIFQYSPKHLEIIGNIHEK